MLAQGGLILQGSNSQTEEGGTDGLKRGLSGGERGVKVNPMASMCENAGPDPVNPDGQDGDGMSPHDRFEIGRQDQLGQVRHFFRGNKKANDGAQLEQFMNALGVIGCRRFDKMQFSGAGGLQIDPIVYVEGIADQQNAAMQGNLSAIHREDTMTQARLPDRGAGDGFAGVIQTSVHLRKGLN
jgi:hypothetical protein